VIGLLQSQGLLKVQKSSGEKLAPDVDYSQSHSFAFSTWKQWDPNLRQFFENTNLSHMRPQCVDAKFGFCSSGYLHPTNLYRTIPVLVYVPVSGVQKLRHVELRQVYFRLLDGVFHDLRPVYEMVIEGRNGILQSETVQWYLYHKTGKWRVGVTVGSLDYRTGMFLELDGNAMRVEYENETEWHLVDLPLHAGPIRRRAFGGLQCSRQLPDGMSCHVVDNVTCENGGICQTDTSGVSSCLCPAGYRGIQCKHRVSECTTSLQTPPQSSSVFGGPAPHYEGNIMTVFCSSGRVAYSVCQSGSWQPTSAAVCSSQTLTYLPTTRKWVVATTPLATTTTWSFVYNQTENIYIDEDSIGKIASVIVGLVCVQLGCPLLCYCCIACCQYDDEHADEEIPADAELKLDTQKRKTSLVRTCSGFFYVCWWAWLIFAIIYAVFGNVPLDGSTVLSAVAIMAFVCLAVLYCCVFFESFCSHEYNYLSQLENEEVTAGEQITEMKAAKPTITFRAECSRNETRTRTVWRCC